MKPIPRESVCHELNRKLGEKYDVEFIPLEGSDTTIEIRCTNKAFTNVRYTDFLREKIYNILKDYMFVMRSFILAPDDISYNNNKNVFFAYRDHKPLWKD